MKALKGLTVAVALAVAAAGNATAQTKPSGTFRQAHEVGFGNASSLDPISRGRVFQVTEKIMNRLVRPGLDGKPAPDLALSWTANADATEWIFKLRPNVAFHNGKAFSAADVVFSLGRIKDPKLDSPVRATIAIIDAVEAVDPMTVRMKLKSSFADLPLLLTDYRIVMLAEGTGDTVATTGIGTGPFKVEKFDASGTTILTANMSYFDGPPGVERMEIIGIPDAQARVQALLAGQIDMVPGITRQQRPLIERSTRHRIQDIPTGNWRGIAFNTEAKPFDDARVRKAVRLAADRKGLLDLVVGANGGVIGCDNPISPTDQYRSTKTCAQDIAGAKALLASAGHPNGIDFELHVSTIESIWPTLAEAFQQQVAPAGIRVKIVQVPSDGYWNNIWRKKEAVMTRWNDRPADSVFNEIYRSGATWNETHLKDAKLDGMLDAARRELDFDKRRTIYMQAQDQLWENGGTLVAFHVNVVVGTTARVKNLDAVENFSIRWDKVTVD